MARDERFTIAARIAVEYGQAETRTRLAVEIQTREATDASLTITVFDANVPCAHGTISLGQIANAQIPIHKSHSQPYQHRHHSQCAPG